jgi:hypothetical protein
MIDFEHYRDALSHSIEEAYGYLSSSRHDVKYALLCVLEAMGEMNNMLDELAEIAKSDNNIER